ncbi:MAG: translation initiation factor IF-2 [Candidatus Woesearchaeota archaeon]
MAKNQAPTQQQLRSPICTVVGHVDHGKSSLLDYIRGTSVVEREAGAITQAIGASLVPVSEIKKRAGKLVEQLNLQIKVPSLLFIDTPGHAAFTNLRKRGGNLADLAIVVIDINEGIMPQTKEAIEILRHYRTPFLIALNKIDLVNGFVLPRGIQPLHSSPSFSSSSSPLLLEILKSQSPQTTELLETKLYAVVGKLYELFGLNAERYDRIDDFTKHVAVVPISAKLGIGISELLVMILGLAQRYLGSQLQLSLGSGAKGTVLEVKEQKGLGTVLDVILYDGQLAINDTIVIGSLDKPIITKVKGLFEPLPLNEIMDKKAKFAPVKQVTAAVGVRIVAKDLEQAIAGMPLRSCPDSELAAVCEQIMKEIEEVTLDTDPQGIVVKADSLGSLEALLGMLKAKQIPVVKASVGPITKSDLIDCQACFAINPKHGVILGFNVLPNDDVLALASQQKIKIITSPVIYPLLEAYDAWVEEQQRMLERQKLEKLTPVAKVELLTGYVFRQSNPAILGAEVLAGKVVPGMQLMLPDGRQVTEIKALQKENKSISSAGKGEQVALSLLHVTIGRQIKEGDLLYSVLSEDEFREYKAFKDSLSGEEKALLKEIADIMRKQNPVWGV